jgi:hypothetical protein
MLVTAGTPSQLHMLTAPAACAQALQANDQPRYDHGIEVMYRFANFDPFQRSRYFGKSFDLGQFERFRRIMHIPAYTPLLNHESWQVLSTLKVCLSSWGSAAGYAAAARKCAPPAGCSRLAGTTGQEQLYKLKVDGFSRRSGAFSSNVCMCYVHSCKASAVHSRANDCTQCDVCCCSCLSAYGRRGCTW